MRGCVALVESRERRPRPHPFLSTPLPRWTSHMQSERAEREERPQILASDHTRRSPPHLQRPSRSSSNRTPRTLQPQLLHQRTLALRSPRPFR